MKLGVKVFLACSATVSADFQDDGSLVQKISMAKVKSWDRFWGSMHSAAEEYASKQVDEIAALARNRSKRLVWRGRKQTEKPTGPPPRALFVQMKDALVVSTSKIKELGAKEASEGPCKEWCKAAVGVDVLLLVLAAFGIQCGPASLLVYYLFGFATFVGDAKMGVAEAMQMLAQMSTTVGYGDTGGYDPTVGDKNPCAFKTAKYDKKNETPEVYNETLVNKHSCGMYELFHSFHSWVGVMLVNTQWDTATSLWLYSILEKSNKVWHVPRKFIAVIFLLLELSLSTLVYAYDDREKCKKDPTNEWCSTENPKFKSMMNALYMNIMSFSSVGYGDLAPNTGWGKTLSPMLMQLGTNFFNTLADVVSRPESDPWEEPNAGDEFETWYNRCIPISIQDAAKATGAKDAWKATKEFTKEFIKR